MNPKPLKVLQVLGTMNRGGAEIMVMDLFRNTSPEVHFDFLVNVKIDQPKPQGDFDPEILRRGAQIFHIGTQWDLGVIRYIWRFRKILRQAGVPDVVHIHLNSRCGVIALAARLSGVKKVVAHSHGNLTFKGGFPQVLAQWAELTLQKLLIATFATDFWGCSSPANRRLYYKGKIAAGETVVINNAINVKSFLDVTKSTTERLKKTLDINDSRLVIGNMGRIVRYKNVAHIVEVLKVLKSRGVDFVFVFAGRIVEDGYMAEIQAKISSYQLEKMIRYIGDRDDVPEVMSTFDVFVGPARNEPFGMVIVEAQAAGLPCVLSAEYPENVDMGLGLVAFVEDFVPEVWADAIQKSAGAPRLGGDHIYRKLAERGFDVVNNTRHIEGLYRC